MKTKLKKNEALAFGRVIAEIGPIEMCFSPLDLGHNH